MHRIFGVKESAVYLDREGAYLVPVRQHQVGVVQTPKGYFLLGGGLEKGESHRACIHRECLEEAGLSVRVGRPVCSAETYAVHPQLGYFHPIQTYYLGDVLCETAVPTEADHHFRWIEYAELKGSMAVEMQNWALEQCVASANV